MMQNLSIKFIHSSMKSMVSSVSSHSIIRPTSNAIAPVRYRDTATKATFLIETIGMSRKKALSTILTVKQFRSTSLNSMKQSFDILKNIGYEFAIETHPELLCVNYTTLKNRVMLMEDCSFNKDKIPELLLSYDSLLEKKLCTLKQFEILPSTVNIVENFFLICNIPLTENTIQFDDWDTFRSIYYKFFKFYVQRELNLSDEEVKIVSTRATLISLRYLKYNIKLIRDVFHVRSNDLPVLKYLLHAYPDTILYLFKTLKNVDMKRVIKKTPELVGVSSEIVEKNHRYLQEKNVSEVAPAYMSLLAMTSELNLNRLSKILESYELHVYKNHPRFLQLINRLHVAQERLEVLEKLNMRCHTLNQLICSDEKFVSHVSHGIDKIQSRDKFTFLSQEIPYTISEIRKRLRLNPYAGYIPIHIVTETTNYLKTVGFSAEDIFISLPIVLYHKNVVENAIEKLVPELLRSMNYSVGRDKTKHKAYLPLTLYCIEKPHNFTGNGVWIQKDQPKRKDLYIE